MQKSKKNWQSKDKKAKQFAFLKDDPKSYGGELRRTRKGRGARPLDTKNTVHLVLRSTHAVGKRAFWTKENRPKIENIIKKFSEKNGVQVVSGANVGNHLHFHIKISGRFTYKRFIRAITAAIAMAVTGASRWNSLAKMGIKQFWDRRPFTRVVVGFRAFLRLKDYIEINQLEGLGYDRFEARIIIEDTKKRPWAYERPPDEC